MLYLNPNDANVQVKLPNNNHNKIGLVGRSNSDL